MKKSFAILAALCCTLALSATSYTCHLKVTVNGSSTEQDEVLVEINETNGKYDLNLRNFCLTADGVTVPVGNIAVTGVEGVDEFGYTTILFTDNINITPGDDPRYDESDWIGAMLGDVPLDLTSRFTDSAMSANIDIDLASTLGQTVVVTLFGVAPTIDGDVNHDGEVNIGDVNRVIKIILGN